MYSDFHKDVPFTVRRAGGALRRHPIQMIFAAALTAPHAEYDGPAHGGMANGAGVFVKAVPFFDIPGAVSKSRRLYSASEWRRNARCPVRITSKLGFGTLF